MDDLIDRLHSLATYGGITAADEAIDRIEALEAEVAALRADAVKALEAAGWRVVPAEMTDEMIVAGSDAVEHGEPDGSVNQASYAWAAMLRAAPKP